MQPSLAQQFFEQGIAAARAGDLAAAEQSLRKCIELDPRHAVAMLNLGLVRKNRGNLPGAEQVLLQSVNTNASLESITALAEVLAAQDKFEKAEECYRVILSAVPKHSPTLLRLAELADLSSERRKACDWFRQSWEADPRNLTAGIGYALKVYDDNSAETDRAFSKLLSVAADDAQQEGKILSALLPYKEFIERVKRGLPPYHGISLDELFFTYAKEHFERFRELSIRAAESNPHDPGASLRKFIALFCSGERRASQECLRHAGDAVAEQIYENIEFDPVFYQRLETATDSDILKNLPPLTEMRTTDPVARPVIYLSCNFGYFENFAAPMLRSIATVAPGQHVHVHIMDMEKAEQVRLKKFLDDLPGLNIAVSVEQPGIGKKSGKTSRAYYHAIRFIRFYFHLKKYNCPLWLMDVDALAQRDPRELFAMLGDSDTAFRIRPGRLEPWNQFNACIVGAAPTEASLRYFRLVAAYITHFHQQDRLRWGIDQLAMYGVFEYLRDAGKAPSVSLLGERAIDYDYRDDGIVWCNSGRNKFLHLNRKPGVPLASLDPDRAKYLELFEKYYSPI